MHNATTIEVKATGAEMTIELGFIPSYAIVMNVTSGSRLEYVNTRLGMSQMAIDNAVVTNDIGEFTDYVNASGVLATDGKLKRTPAGTVGRVSATAAGLVLAAGIANINDTATEQLIIIAFRSEL
jgi:hypothetical protein